MIFEPHYIGRLKIRNRFVRSATHDGMADSKGQVTDTQVSLYTRLAGGGVGLIVTGLANVNSSGRLAATQMDISSDHSIDGLRRLVEASHKHGARIAAQLSHAGREAYRYQTALQRTAVAPSVFGDDPYFEGSCRELTENEIHQLILEFGNAAFRAKEAGFDGVQIHGAHAYLFSQFLSPFTNRRDDMWGGSLENRSRFLRETCREIRRRIGNEYPVMVKLGVEDGFDGGLSFEEGAIIAERCPVWGFDALEISQGLRGHFYTETEFKTGIDGPEKEAYFRDWCREIKSRVNIPVMMVGGLRGLEQMKDIIENNEADFVSLCRPLIREPDLINAWKDDPAYRPACISCNRCFAAIRKREPLSCGIRK